MANITIPGLPAKTGTILDAAYLHLNESSVDKKVTIAQLLAKISAQYSANIVTFLGSANNAEARANLEIDRRTTVDDAIYTILATDKVVAQIGTMSAARVWSLPAASTFPAGGELIIIDESGTVTSTNKITVQRNGTDTIDGATSIDILNAYGFLKLICNGTDSWKIINNYSATKAEQEAGTSSLKVVTPSNQQDHKSSCKAWVNFNGTGTIAIRDSYNVSSIVDNGVGDYTINFTTPFSSANYVLAGSAEDTSDAGVGKLMRVVCPRSNNTGTSSLTPSSARITTLYSDTNSIDCETVVASFFGDQ
jgi:hypothetical protein